MKSIQQTYHSSLESVLKKWGAGRREADVLSGKSYVMIHLLLALCPHHVSTHKEGEILQEKLTDFIATRAVYPVS